MNTAKIIYRGNLRTECTHLRSRNMLITDAPPDNQGKGEAFSPADLLATALGGCMLTIIGIAANTHNFNIDGTEVSITKLMADNPRRVKEVVVEFEFPANNFSAKEKVIIEKAARTCPVALSLHPDVVQTVRFNYL